MIKKSLLFCGLLVTLFTSCENPAIFGNEETEDPQGNLKVSIHQIEQTPFSALTRAEAGIACTRLNFVVYDEFGVRVDQENQQSTDANFGTASFQLPEGDYQMVVLGHSSNGNPTLTNAKKITFSNKIGFSDTFLYSKKITVTDEPENLEVELKRIVSLCRFVITDDYPEDIARIRFYYTGGSGAFDATTGFGSVASKQEVFFDVDRIVGLDQKTGNEVVGCLLSSACQSQNDRPITLGRQYLTMLPKGWVIDRIKEVVTTVLDLNDDWEYRR